jgi:ribosomal protein S18 acetylase RimI-like enzyme
MIACMAPAEDLVIEEVAVRAWPALVAEEEDGWLLRATPRVARRRSNSALPPVHGALGGLSLVEAFYKERNTDILIQVSPAHRHEELDRHLEAQGYQLDAPTLVLRAPVAQAGRAERPSCRVELSKRDDHWTRTAAAIDGRAATDGELVMDRITGQTVFARAIRDDTGLGVGAGVLDDGWFGIFSMGTLPAYRHSGVATALLAALLHWAQDAGAHSAWLQVEENNLAARRLYDTHGFEYSHRYHYRRLPIG